MADNSAKTPQQRDPLAIASAVMGNRTKSMIVRCLWQRGSATGVTIAAETGLSSPTLSLAMQQLEAWDIVSGSIPKEKRHGRTVTYTLDRAKIRELVEHWTAFIEGTS